MTIKQTVLGMAILLLSACQPTPGDITSGDAVSPAFCAELPRPGWAAFEKNAASNNWFEVYQLAYNLFAISEPHQWQEVISYLIIGSDRALLFDSGNGIGDIRSVVNELTDKPVSVLASHSHFDHVGGHWQFETVLAPDTAFTNGRARGVDNDFVREEVSAAALCKPLPDGVSAEHFTGKAFSPSERVTDGTQIDLGGIVLEVLAIPGHTPDSLALLDKENGRLFSGDSYYKGPIWLFAPETDLKSYRTSIARMAALAPILNAVHGAHNEPFSDPAELLKVRDALEDILAGTIAPTETNAELRRYKFENFELLLPVEFG